MPSQIRIKPVTAATYDQSGDQTNISMNVAGGPKTFIYNGVPYTISGNEVKTVPDEVATTWIANDSSIELLPRGFK